MFRFVGLVFLDKPRPKISGVFLLTQAVIIVVYTLRMLVALRSPILPVRAEKDKEARKKKETQKGFPGDVVERSGARIDG